MAIQSKDIIDQENIEQENVPDTHIDEDSPEKDSKNNEETKKENTAKGGDRVSLVSSVTGPLKMIAVFATSSEVIVTLALPFIEDTRNQLVLIAFLVFYPAFLTYLFFSVLKNDNLVLYAPADYANQKDFIEAQKIQLQTKERIMATKQVVHSQVNDEEKIKTLEKALEDIDKLQDKYQGL